MKTVPVVKIRGLAIGDVLCDTWICDQDKGVPFINGLKVSSNIDDAVFMPDTVIAQTVADYVDIHTSSRVSVRVHEVEVESADTESKVDDGV